MRFQLSGRDVDLERCLVHGPDGAVPLTPQEAQILRFLAEQRGRAVTRDELLQAVWGYPNAAPTRAVDNAIYRLRTKIEDDPAKPLWLKTARGVGYCFEPPLSPQASGLHGRDLDLVRLGDALDRHRRATLVGPAGIGKTSLAHAWAARVGAAFVPLSGVQAGGVASALADALDVPLAPSSSGAVAIDRVGRALQSRGQRAVVLDNAEDLPGEIGDVVSVWTQLDLTVLVTSQDPLGYRGEVLVTLGPVSDSAARSIYLAAAPAHAQLDHMLERLDGIPLAILLAAARAEQLGPGEVVALLDATDARTTKGTLPALSAALEAGLARLPGPEAAVLDAITLFPQGAPLDALAHCTDRPTHEVLTALDGLRARALLRRPGTATFPIIGRLRDPDLSPELLRRWACWLKDHPQRTDLLRGARRLGEAAPALAAELWLLLNRPMLLQGPLIPDWADAGVLTAERSGDPAAVARAYLLRGAIRTLGGQLDGAAADLGLASSGPEPVAIEAEIRIGWATLFAGRPQEALVALERARDRARTGGHGALEAMAEVRLASVQHRLGHADRATLHLQRALGLYEGLNAPEEVARSRSNLAMMHVELGQTDQAREQLRRALDLDRAHGVRAAIPQHLLNLGGVELDAGNLDLAREHLQEALSTALAFGDEETHALCLLSLGVAHAVDGEDGPATTYLSRARLQLQRSANPMVVGIAWTYLAIASAAPSETASALARATDTLGPIDAPALVELLALARAAQRLPDKIAAQEALDHTAGPRPSFVRVARQLLQSRLDRIPT